MKQYKLNEDVASWPKEKEKVGETNTTSSIIPKGETEEVILAKYRTSRCQKNYCEYKEGFCLNPSSSSGQGDTATANSFLGLYFASMNSSKAVPHNIQKHLCHPMQTLFPKSRDKKESEGDMISTLAWVSGNTGLKPVLRKKDIILTERQQSRKIRSESM